MKHLTNALQRINTIAALGALMGLCSLALPYFTLRPNRVMPVGEPVTLFDLHGYGWTCALETHTDGTRWLHFTLDPALRPAKVADAAQFFLFTLTAPTVSTPTRYGAVAGTGFATGDGFRTIQTYD